MKSTFLSLPACALILAPCCATAATMVFPKAVNLAIPDNNGNGLVSVINVSTSGQYVTAVEVVLTTSSGWNGDLYAYLEHNGVISVLLNRPGRTDANPAGAGSSGMTTITLVDSAILDVHTGMPAIAGMPATGIYQPDARAADPGLVTDNSSRTLYLYGFTDHLADGDWTLFVADLADGGVATLNNWELSLTVIPEPGVALLGSLGMLALLRRRRY